MIDRFLEDAFEFDVDVFCDGERAVVCGILQHIEEAGIHSGDSAAVLPPYRRARRCSTRCATMAQRWRCGSACAGS